jgi:hypothetical protein
LLLLALLQEGSNMLLLLLLLLWEGSHRHGCRGETAAACPLQAGCCC